MTSPRGTGPMWMICIQGERRTAPRGSTPAQAKGRNNREGASEPQAAAKAGTNGKWGRNKPNKHTKTRRQRRGGGDRCRTARGLVPASKTPRRMRRLVPPLCKRPAPLRPHRPSRFILACVAPTRLLPGGRRRRDATALEPQATLPWTSRGSSTNSTANFALNAGDRTACTFQEEERMQGKKQWNVVT